MDFGISDIRAPVVGQRYTLICSVTGTSVVTYEWRKDGNELLSETGPTLSFYPLRLSDAGSYVCFIHVVGRLLSTRNVDITLLS